VARLDPIPFDNLTPEQKAVHAKLLSTRKQVTGPFAIWLHTPNVAHTADEFMNSLRWDGKLDKRLYELIVLIVTRHWSARYAWAQHEPLAPILELERAQVGTAGRGVLRDPLDRAFADRGELRHHRLLLHVALRWRVG
jgi:4-carboxymuconolactone decarboxylase